MQRFLGFILVTIQALGIPLVAGLFICAVTGEPNLTLEWPFLIDVESPLLEILLLSLPSILLYVSLIRVLKGRLWRAVSFVLQAVLAAYFSCVVFAQAFGNTWTQSEIFFALFLRHLHLLAIALLPGLLLWWLIDVLRTVMCMRLAACRTIGLQPPGISH